MSDEDMAILLSNLPWRQNPHDLCQVVDIHGNHVATAQNTDIAALIVAHANTSQPKVIDWLSKS
jgi:hypothetical protein